MTDRPAGPVEVRPNTLQGQSVPNTFRTDAGAAAPLQYLNSGGGNMAAPIRRTATMIPFRAFIVVAVVVIFVALYLLTGTP